MKKFLSLILVFFVLVSGAAQVKISVNNDQPRKDLDGEIVDAHDGRIIQFGKKFYWYGTAYKNTNGFTKANSYVSYSSADLKNWRAEGDLLVNKPAGVYYRPHVVYNRKTHKYVLWYNWYPELWKGQFGVAVSDSPTGPFQILNDDVKVKHSSLGVGDLGIFVDDDGQAYLSYNTISGHRVSVERLNETYTSSTLEGSAFLAEHCEAGSMFKRQNIYYLLTDQTCCFCTQGSGAQVYTASSPLGPYTYRQNINRHPGHLTAHLKDGIMNDNWFEPLSPGKRSALQIEISKPTPINTLTVYQFTGNRQGQCGEVDKPKVHEPIEKYAFKLSAMINGEWTEVKANTVAEHGSMKIVYRVSFNALTTDAFRITPVFADSAAVVNVMEVSLQIPRTNYSIFALESQGSGKPIIPAQQNYVMELMTTRGKEFVWMGDLWGSASDNIKGHDYQYWSPPLEFYKNGLIRPLIWVGSWGVSLK